MLVGGAWSTIANLWVFGSALHAGRPVEEAMALTFVCLVLIELFKVYNYRSDRESVFRSPFANRWVNLAVGWEIVLLLIIVHVPFLQAAFGTFSLDTADWIRTATVALTIIPVLELAKLLARHRLLGRLE
jgi:Ca2+-transporting ATPase